MFTLYEKWDAQRNLAPQDFQFILSPDEALKLAAIFYELDYQKYRTRPHFPERKHGARRYFTQPYRRKDRYWFDGLYDDTKWKLELGWIIGVDTAEPWSHFRNPCYFDDHGELVCDSFMDHYGESFERSVREAWEKCLGNHQGRKPAPTVKIHFGDAPVQHAQAGKTLNSKAVGRLLAAGGIYNQNPQMFAETAQKLGGEASQGFDQILNEQSVGSLVALSSVFAAGRFVTHPPSMRELNNLKSYLGAYKGNKILLNNIEVIKMNYVKRTAVERMALRREFEGVRKQFLKSVADNSEIKKRLDLDDLARMRKGLNPIHWDVHHKFPLDDSGTNDFSNLMLISKSPEHAMFTTTQRKITQSISAGGSTEILWPVPKGIIYP